MKKVFTTICIVALVVICTFTLAGCAFNPDTESKTFTVDGDLKVGIISDSQLPPTKEEDDGIFKQNLINALSGLKAQDVNMIIFAGDVSDEASNYAYDQYVDCYVKVFGADKSKWPIVQTIMGNHDYWGGHDGMLSKSSYRKRFEEKLGISPYTHYVVNGFHFIGASPQQGSPMENQHATMIDWLDGEIAKAVANDATKPVFVITHNSAENTVYGSEDWGDKKLYDVFKKYPQVVNISGHLHYSILDERSMWQGDFTAFSTQSVSYTELEVGKANGTVPPNSAITPMGEIMEFGSDKILIKRMNFGKIDAETGAYGVEEKADRRWELPLNISKDKFTYTNAIKQQNNKSPEMTATSGSFRNDGDKTFVSWLSGKDDDFVHSYKLVWSGTKQLETLYFTDFINGIADMKEQVEYQVYDVPAGTYNVKVYAVDSFGKVSANCTEINGVVVKAKYEYKKQK